MYAIYELSDPYRVIHVGDSFSSYDSNIYGYAQVPVELEVHSPYFSVIDNEVVYTPSKEEDTKRVR